MRKLVVLVLVLGAGTAVADDKPSLTLGTPRAVVGSADAKAVTAVMKAASARLLACYKAANQAGAGTATATFKLGVDGKVTSAGATGLASSDVAPVHNCIAEVITTLKFPKPKDGEVVEISFPLIFSSGKPANDLDAFGGLDGPGPGWSTIGTGTYGTIGHGSGFGVGGFHGTPSDVPTVSIGQPVVKGDLDKAIIRRYVKRHIQKISYCYEKELLATKALQGTVTAQFTINAEGNVTSSTASGLRNTNVEDCVDRVIEGITFPKPKSAEAVVTYPITFRPPMKKPAAKKK